MILTEPEEAFKLSRYILLKSGLWPMENKSSRYKLKTAISWAAILGVCLPLWMETFNDIHNLVKLSINLNLLITILNIIIKQIAFTTNYKTFQETLALLKNPVFASHPEELDYFMVNTVNFSRRLVKTYLVGVTCGLTLLGVYPIIDKKTLPLPFPYDVGNYTFLIYIFQMIFACIGAWNYTGLDTIFISLIDIAAAQLDILAEKIVRIKAPSEFYADRNKRDEDVLKQLKHCVEHHLAIIKLIENTEKIFSVAIFAQYFGSSLILCNTIFSFIWMPLSFQLLFLADYLVVILIQLFIFCWCGDKIITKTLKIGDACYTFNWYDYGLPVRKYIFIMMERSKRPSCIRGLKFTALSIQSLTCILQRAYSMLTILLDMYKEASTEN